MPSDFLLQCSKYRLHCRNLGLDSGYGAVQQFAAWTIPNSIQPEHSMLNNEQFAAAQKANVAALIGLTAKAFEGIEQLTALNLQVVKTSIDEAGEASNAALSVKDPQSLIALQTGGFQPAAEKAAAYGRQVYDIFAATKAEVEKVAAEQAAGIQNSVIAAFDAATKNAPEGAGSGVAFFKSAISAANNAFDGMQKATRQATSAAEANYTAVTGSVVKAAGKSKRG
jgi:phasin family protein